MSRLAYVQGELFDRASKHAALQSDASLVAGAPTAHSDRAHCPTGFHWDHCPNCAHELVNQGCKYRCPRCHYFMSCSDFD